MLPWTPLVTRRTRWQTKDGRLIGFEVLNYLSTDESRDFTVLPVESAILA